jgi:hypothetical protein
MATIIIEWREPLDPATLVAQGAFALLSLLAARMARAATLVMTAP